MALSVTRRLCSVAVLQVMFLLRCGESVCDSNTQFTCCGGSIECVDLSQQNNSRFDCADGSDESPNINETLADRGCCNRPNAFHCLSGGCVPSPYILDGYNDCVNGNDALADDEHKYIGTNCKASLDPGLCCPCDLYVTNSECVDKTGEYLCYCKSGYIADDLGKTCTKRKFGDPCDVDPDCYDAIADTVCPPDTKRCACPNGWVFSNNSHCVEVIAKPTDKNGCSDILNDCPWIVGVVVVVFVVILATCIILGVLLSKKHRKAKHTPHNLKPVKVHPLTGVPIMYETESCKEPEDITDIMLRDGGSVFYTPDPSPPPVA